jgi:phosphatidylglycerol---prolipoprotein diacylglyceryl transferase
MARHAPSCIFNDSAHWSSRCFGSADGSKAVTSMQIITISESDASESHSPSLTPSGSSFCHADLVVQDNGSALLDAIVASANRLTLFGVRYRPYWVMSDAAAVLALFYAWAFARRFPHVSGLALGLALVVTLLVYRVVLEIKAALRKTAARSFLQDCVLVIIPCFLLVSHLLRQPLDLTLAFLGTLVPLYGCLARIGCFLGGCCYGRPSSSGVLYPASIFEQASPGCRKYAPSPNPGVRVFPIQLVEAAAQGILFVLLATLIWKHPNAPASVFWWYLSLYTGIRFVLDFCRTTSARPRYGRFSEAQLACLVIQAIAITVLIHG